MSSQETRDKNAIMLVLAHADQPISYFARNAPDAEGHRNLLFSERVRLAIALAPLLDAVRQGKDPLDWVTNEHPGRLDETAPTEGHHTWPSST